MKEILHNSYVLVLVLWLTPSIGMAHHSVGGTFDSDKPIVVEGTVTELEWANPHIWIHFTVRQGDGSSAQYQCEGSSPNSLRRRGWSRESVKPGDTIQVEGLQARNDSFSCYARAVRLADGTRLFSGTASEIE